MSLQSENCRRKYEFDDRDQSLNQHLCCVLWSNTLSINQNDVENRNDYSKIIINIVSSITRSRLTDSMCLKSMPHFSSFSRFRLSLFHLLLIFVCVFCLYHSLHRSPLLNGILLPLCGIFFHFIFKFMLSSESIPIASISVSFRLLLLLLLWLLYLVFSLSFIIFLFVVR